MTPLHSGVGVIIVISQIIIIIFELAGGILIVTILGPGALPGLIFWMADQSSSTVNSFGIS